MGHFWTSFFEHLRDCGRNATLFLVALTGFFLLLSLGALVYALGWYRYLVLAWPVIAIAALVRLVVLLRRRRSLRRQHDHVAPLSENELHRARAKLRKRRT